MAGNGNDFIFFQGTLGQLAAPVVNAYTSESLIIEENKNINTSAYNGLDGYDTLLMTNVGDALFITDAGGALMIQNIEAIVAGEGGDVVNLSSQEIILNDILITGGGGNDILWGNAGSDTIAGAAGDDIIDGGPGDDILSGNIDNDHIKGGDGNDTISGNEDDDILFGNAGSDTINGGSGNDILYGGSNDPLVVIDKDFVDPIIFPELIERVNIKNLKPPGDPALGINEGNLEIDYQADATLTFRKGFAGYNNTLGTYRINEDGTISDAQILFTNVKDAGVNVAHTIDLPVGEEGGEFGFFIIANGDRVNHDYTGLDNIEGAGAVEFIYDFGGAGERAATLADDGRDVSIVYSADGLQTVLSGKHYHTTERGETTDINWDGKTHVVSGLVTEDNTQVLRIGFEDLPMLGDADYEDVLFDLDIVEQTTDISENDPDILIGGAGDDLLYAEGGDDLLILGEGLDQATGGAGADQFILDTLDDLTDVITDFDSGMGGDILNLTDILELYDPMTDLITDFVSVEQGENGTTIFVNASGIKTGDPAGDFVAAALLQNTQVTLTTLIENGALVLDQSITI